MAGSPRALTRPTCRRPRRCWRSWGEMVRERKRVSERRSFPCPIYDTPATRHVTSRHRRTTGCSRRLTASAALPLPGAAEPQRSPHTEHLRLEIAHSHRHQRRAHDMRHDPGNQPETPSRSRAAPPRRLSRRRCAVVLGCAAAAALLVGCRKETPATAATADASAASAAEKRDAALTEVIRTGMQHASIPGAIVGVWREGQPPYVRALGVRDTASGQPMATDLSMRIGSNTKAFVVTGILMLADQGKLGLDDPIDRYVKGARSGDG